MVGQRKTLSAGSSMPAPGAADIRSPRDFEKKKSKFHPEQHNWNIWTLNKLNNLMSHLLSESHVYAGRKPGSVVLLIAKNRSPAYPPGPDPPGAYPGSNCTF